ncbi:MAG TPA: TonB-dependent siderophore receptor [Cellvibrio sp.]|nr:TonB-dependent siderophore receptor [Cellvibrio sp.]
MKHTLLNISLLACAISTATTALAQQNSEKPQKLNTVKVEATVIEDGSADNGYKSEAISQVGIWEGRSLQDTPYSINVVSSELIENLQATSADQVFKINPATQYFWPQTQNDNPYVFLRGFQTTTFARNGISRQKWNYAHGTTMEEIERMEVLTGLSGFIYGAGNLGGMVNFITKKPTADRLNSITLGNAGGQNYYAHGDFGGQIDSNGTFGYRINLVTQDGETTIDKQNNKRDFISAAFDWQVTDSLLIDIDASKRDYRLDGRNAYWSLANNATPRPDADDIDTGKIWSHPWAMQEMESERLGTNIRWEISKNIKLRAGYLDEYNSRTGTTATNTIQANGTFNQRITTNEDAPQKIMGTGGYLFTDFHFSTGNIQHKLTTGLQNSTSIWDNYPDGSVGQNFNGLKLDKPVYFNEPVWAAHGTQPVYPAYDQRTRSLTIGDDIQFNQHWSALLGLSDSKVYYKNFNTSGVVTEHYKKSEVTPTVSLIYKPIEQLTTYASYMEGLEQGGVAGKLYQTYEVTNPDEIMDPLISKQVEWGIKASVGKLLLTSAIFNIDKPLEYYQILSETQAQFVQDGRQQHKGIEFSATGKITDNLTLLGGFTLLDAKVKDNKQFPEIEGKKPVGVAEKLIKFYSEYNISAVPGLSVNGGASYTGEFFGNNINTDKLPAYTLIDLGARYILPINDTLVTLRLNVNNLTDEHYWANQSFLGDPRNLVFSANVHF